MDPFHILKESQRVHHLVDPPSCVLDEDLFGQVPYNCRNLDLNLVFLEPLCVLLRQADDQLVYLPV